MVFYEKNYFEYPCILMKILEMNYKSKKYQGVYLKITSISVTNCPILLNMTHDQSLYNGVSYDTKCATLGKLAAEIWAIL